MPLTQGIMRAYDSLFVFASCLPLELSHRIARSFMQQRLQKNIGHVASLQNNSEPLMGLNMLGLWAGACPSLVGWNMPRLVGWNRPVACGLEYVRRLWAETCPSFVGVNMPGLWAGACPSLVAWNIPGLWAGTSPSLVGWNMSVAHGLGHARRLMVRTCPV